MTCSLNFMTHSLSSILKPEVWITNYLQLIIIIEICGLHQTKVSQFVKKIYTYATEAGLTTF
jgi:hypothetical protein